MTIWIILILCVVAVIFHRVWVSISAKRRKGAGKSAFVQGLSSLIDGDYHSALSLLREAVREQPQEVEHAEPLKEELKCFVNCLRNDIRPPVSGDESIHALGVALGAIESYQRNLPMRIHGDGAFDFLAEVVRENDIGM